MFPSNRKISSLYTKGQTLKKKFILEMTFKEVLNLHTGFAKKTRNSYIFLGKWSWSKAFQASWQNNAWSFSDLIFCKKL